MIDGQLSPPRIEREATRLFGDHAQKVTLGIEKL
jgi:hypothetical protein